MAAIFVENWALRGRCSPSSAVSVLVSRSVFAAAGGSVVRGNNVKVSAALRGGLGEAGRLESRFVPARKSHSLPHCDSFDRQLNCGGRIGSRRGGGARSAVVTKQPVTDKGDSAKGFEKWVIAAEQGFNMFATDPSKFFVTAPEAVAETAAPAASAVVEEKEKEKEESDDDMGFSLFD